MPGLEADRLISDIEQYASTEEEKELLRESTHSSLLYVYRNHLVHEFREPGHGMEMDQRNVFPYYHSLTRLSVAGERSKDTWELVYPLGFLANRFEIVSEFERLSSDERLGSLFVL